MVVQHAATFSAWQVRATCVEALGKIALRSIASADDEQAYLALSVYEFLSATNADDNYGLQLVAAPIVQLMDHLYEAREWLVLKLQPSATTAAAAAVASTAGTAHPNDVGVAGAEDRDGGHGSGDLGEEVRSKHAKLTQQVSLFCPRLEPGYLPMGPESASLIFDDAGDDAGGGGGA